MWRLGQDILGQFWQLITETWHEQIQFCQTRPLKEFNLTGFFLLFSEAKYSLSHQLRVLPALLENVFYHISKYTNPCFRRVSLDEPSARHRPAHTAAASHPWRGHHHRHLHWPALDRGPGLGQVRGPCQVTRSGGGGQVPLIWGHPQVKKVRDNGWIFLSSDWISPPQVSQESGSERWWSEAWGNMEAARTVSRLQVIFTHSFLDFVLI